MEFSPSKKILRPFNLKILKELHKHKEWGCLKAGGVTSILPPSLSVFL